MPRLLRHRWLSRYSTGLAGMLGYGPLHAEPLVAAIVREALSPDHLGWLLVALGAGLAYLVLAWWLRQRRPDPEDGAGRAGGERALVVVLLALFAGAVLVNLFIALRDARHAALARTEQHASNLAHVLEQQTAGSFNAADIALRVIARSGQIQARAPRDPLVDDLLTGAVANLPFARAIWVLDADGDMVHDSEHLPGHYNLADREYFRVHRADEATDLFIDRPTLSKHGVWFVPVSRRIDNADGSFGGVIAAALEPRHLQQYYQSIDVGEQGFVALMSSDGRLLHAPPGMESLMGRPIEPTPQFVARLRSSGHGSYRVTHPFDGIDRLQSYRRLDGRPLVILVGLGVAEHLAPWRASAASYLVGSFAFLLVIVALGAKLLRELARRGRQQARITRLNRMHAVLSGINSLIVRARYRNELFEGSCRIAAEQGEFGAAWIDTLDPATGVLHPVASAGGDAEAILAGATMRLNDVAHWGLVTAAISLRRAAWSNDLRAESGSGNERRRRALERGYRSVIVLPLFLGDEVVATLSLLARKPGMFDVAERGLLDELAGDISFALGHIASQEHIDYLALYDVLTGLPNRTLFLERAAQCVHHAGQHGTLCAMVKIDLERFHKVNASVGWPAGDAILKAVAVRLKAALGERGLAARTERDHFVFVVAEANSAAEIGLQVRQTLLACFDEPLHADNQLLRLAARAGIAVFPGDGGDPDSLLHNAEAALAKAKDSPERLLFYTPAMNARVAGSLALESKLRTALERGQFVLHYQPKFDAHGGAMAGMEGLVRWHDPDNGLVSPSVFIPVLEETGLILEVGEWVMHQAVRDYRRWRERGLAPPRIAVNVSALQLHHTGFAASVRGAIDGAAHADHGLDLEITESVLMTRVESSVAKLEAIRRMGVRIAIDDFGTGYSSLQYIAKLPLDTLKIDRSFVVGMTRNATDREIVASVISLAHQLHLKVTAEGVDAEEQARLLRAAGCDEVQGFLFSRPLAAAAMQALLEQRAGTTAA